MTQRDTLYRIGLGFLGVVSVCLGAMWWLWLVDHMAEAQRGNVAQKAILAGVVFIPIGLFLWLMARLIRPAR